MKAPNAQRSMAQTAVVLWFVISNVAQSAVVPFDSRASFTATLAPLIVETWDDFAAGTTFVDGGSANGITYSTTGADAAVTDLFKVSTDPNGLGSADGGFFSAGNDPTFTFASGVRAFAIDINTFSVVAGAYTATTDTGAVALSVVDTFPADTTGQFIGFSSSAPFKSVTIAAPSGLLTR